MPSFWVAIEKSCSRNQVTNPVRNAHTTSAAVSRLPRLVKTLKSNPMKKLIRFLLFCTIITAHRLVWFMQSKK